VGAVVVQRLAEALDQGPVVIDQIVYGEVSTLRLLAPDGG
jgi:hypothetical protein